jgi:hypothetical protein
MMVIFKGRILRCSQTVQEVGIGMDDLVVVMHIKKKKKKKRKLVPRHMVRPALESTCDSVLPRGTQEYNLGTNYFHGQGGLRQDYSMSFLLWTRAADEGKAFVLLLICVLACFWLGYKDGSSCLPTLFFLY